MNNEQPVRLPQLPSYPEGWYFLARTDELPAGRVLTKRLGDSEVVLFRSSSGELGVLSAFCPHLGAHLGLGGEVVGESLRCPMHAFRFGTDGGCVATGYGTKPPPLARARNYPVFEQDGFVFAWLGRRGEPPSFKIPAVGVEGWSRLTSESWALESHVQETTENSVDIGHLAVVHGYREVGATSPLHTEGPYLTASYAFSRAPVLGRGSNLRVFYTVHVYGLGYSYVEAEVPRFNLRTQQFFFARPIGPGQIELTILARARFTQTSTSGRWFNRLPMRGINNLACRFVFRAYRHDVKQDFVFWRNKRYKQSPALAQGDGPIGPYRRWARQFYVDTSTAEAIHR